MGCLSCSPGCQWWERISTSNSQLVLILQPTPWDKVISAFILRFASTSWNNWCLVQQTGAKLSAPSESCNVTKEVGCGWSLRRNQSFDTHGICNWWFFVKTISFQIHGSDSILEPYSAICTYNLVKVKQFYIALISVGGGGSFIPSIAVPLKPNLKFLTLLVQ